MRGILAAATYLSLIGIGHAQTVYPIDRADILGGARFDLKVEFEGLIDPAKVSVTLNGEDHANVFGKAASFVEREDGKDQSALILRDVALSSPGTYKVRVTNGLGSRELTWNVFADSTTTKMLGLFTLGNMDGALDRKFLKGGTVNKYPEQPDLTEEVRTALDVLSKNESGFFLMVESGLIDKYTHMLDMERAVYDTIMLDNAVKLARDWALAHGDGTLILVLADHNHPIGLVGTIEDDMSKEANTPMRERVRVYERAGFPNYPPPNEEGYPARVDVSRRLALFSASLPNHYETFRPNSMVPMIQPSAARSPALMPRTSATRTCPARCFVSAICRR